jgi:hypothetical protein
MGITRALPDVEEWLEAEASSWSAISDRDYAALVRRCRDTFLPSVMAETPSLHGDRAMQAIAERLPADIWVFSGIRIPEMANMGGQGAAGYEVAGLRNLPRELANHLELVVVAENFSWSCVFSHEAGSCVWECLFEQRPDAQPDAADNRGRG